MSTAIFHAPVPTRFCCAVTLTRCARARALRRRRRDTVYGRPRKRTSPTGGAMADNKKRACNAPSEAVAPDTNADFTYNLDTCVVQASRDDRDAAATGPAAVERVWVVSRPPRLGRGVEPTVTARRAYVVLAYVQGRVIDDGEMVCKRVCTAAKPGQEDDGRGGGGADCTEPSQQPPPVAAADTATKGVCAVDACMR